MSEQKEIMPQKEIELSPERRKEVIEAAFQFGKWLHHFKRDGGLYPNTEETPGLIYSKKELSKAEARLRELDIEPNRDISDFLKSLPEEIAEEVRKINPQNIR